MFCSNCGSANDSSAKFCEKCGAALSAAAAPAAEPDQRVRGQPAPAAPAASPTGKSPGLALVLSLVIPGVGQFYNNDVKKGAVILAGYIIGLFLSYGVLSIPIWIWGMVDAYRVANGTMKKW